MNRAVNRMRFAPLGMDASVFRSRNDRVETVILDDYPLNK